MVKLRGRFWNRGPSKSDLKKELSEVREELQRVKDDMLIKEITPRPEIDYGTRMRKGARIRERDRKWLIKRYELHNECIEMATSTLKIKQECFRQGHEWVPKFAHKCMQCGAEYQDKVPECKKCGHTEFRMPTPEQYLEFENFMKNCNKNKQAAYQVWGELENDVNIIDDLFYLILKDYAHDAQGNIMFETTKEWLRGDPVKMRIVSNEKDVPGGKYWVCINHRNEVLEYPGECPKCGMMCHEVFYVSEEGGNKRSYFIKGEVIHTSKYAPTKLYSANPPAQALYRPAFILNNMSAYIALNYLAGRKPRSIIGIVTNNPKEAYAMWDLWRDESAHDPGYAGMIAIQPGMEGKGEIKKFDLQDTLDEMQYTATRDEYRQRIFGYYGVAPVMAADVSVSGGLNNEGLQLAVTNRAIEMAQALWNNEIFPKLLEMWNITDWELKLKPSEEQDVMAEIQQDIARAQHAQIMQQMGFEVKRNEKGEYEFSKEPSAGFIQYRPSAPASGSPITTPSVEVEVGRQTGMPQNVRRSITKFEGERAVHQEENKFYKDLKSAYTAKILEAVAKLKKRRSLTPEDIEEFLDKTLADAREELEELTRKHYRETYALGLTQSYELLKTASTVPEQIKTAVEPLPPNMTYTLDYIEGIHNPYHFRVFYKGNLVYENKVVTQVEVVNAINQQKQYILKLPTETTTQEEAETLEIVEGGFGQTDEDAIETLTNNSPLWQSYDDMDYAMRIKMNKIIENAYADPDEFNIDKMVNKMREEVDVETYRLERIARTETTVVSAAGRESGFKKRDPEGEFKYKWEGPLDGRTSPVCRAIDRKQGQGLPLEQLKTIMREESRRYNGAGWVYRDWAPHVNCRRSLVRVV